MKKLIFIPMLFFFASGFSQRIDSLVGIKGGHPGKIIADTAVTFNTRYITTPTSTSVGFDSTLITKEIKDTVANYIRFQAVTALTDAATITWNYTTQSQEAKVTLAGNRTLSITNLPTNKVVYLTLVVTQDATGSRTLALPASTKVINGGAGVLTLTTAANSVDILSFRWNGTTLYCTYGKNYN